MDYDAPILEDIIYSNDYHDIIVDENATLFTSRNDYKSELYIKPNTKYAIHFFERNKSPGLNFTNYDYYAIPHCYTTMDSAVQYETGSSFLNNHEQLKLSGKGVLIGFLDTGINYAHPVFIDSAGRSKIYSIWDQTIPSHGKAEGIVYGTEYTSEMINAALQSENPYEIVPSKDLDGHGTQLAGIAAGNQYQVGGFSGMAPGSQLVVVKLKEAKEYLKTFYGIKKETSAYQTTDILMALSYLVSVAIKEQKPMIICIAIGTSLGGVNTQTPLEHYLKDIAETNGFCIVSAMGDEGLAGNTYIGNVNRESSKDNVEVHVGEEGGFTMELWGFPPNIYTVALRSPVGEYISEIAIKGRGTFYHTFWVGGTVLRIDYMLAEKNSGQQIIQISFQNATKGVWTIEVYKKYFNNSNYIIKLPVQKFLPKETFFMHSSPEWSLVKPAYVSNIISVTAYDMNTGNVYSEASWGYEISSVIKPDIAAPGINIYVPDLRKGFTTATGSSIAAACAAGSIALLMEWVAATGVVWAPNTVGTKNFLIRGANQCPGMEAPNHISGYGRLDLRSSYEHLLNY